MGFSWSREPSTCCCDGFIRGQLLHQRIPRLQHSMDSSDWREVNPPSRTKQHDGSLRCVGNQRFYCHWTSSQKNIGSMFNFHRSGRENKLLRYWKQTLFTGLTPRWFRNTLKNFVRGSTQQVGNWPSILVLQGSLPIQII